MAGCRREGKGDGLTIAGQRLRHLVNSVAEKPYPMGRLMRLPLKERLAVALVLDRPGSVRRWRIHNPSGD